MLELPRNPSAPTHSKPPFGCRSSGPETGEYPAHRFRLNSIVRLTFLLDCRKSIQKYIDRTTHAPDDPPLDRFFTIYLGSNNALRQSETGGGRARESPRGRLRVVLCAGKENGSPQQILPSPQSDMHDFLAAPMIDPPRGTIYPQSVRRSVRRSSSVHRALRQIDSERTRVALHAHAAAASYRMLQRAASTDF